jgi:ABC-type branched-subunit amino acid transport system ATPase component
MPEPVHVAPGVLEIDSIQVRFGGLVAVDKLSLTAPTGRITGLIGPNGAGKTTTFNACSGLVRPAAGRVLLDGRAITRRSPSSRARMGIGRTFQQMELFDALSVRENVALGYEASLAGANPLSQVISKPADTRRATAAMTEALSLCGIEEIADTLAGSLSTGQRRLVELARCLTGPYRILLLDEPSSGLDHHESERFGKILQRVVAERGVGILLVEHDMTLVMTICDHIYVMDFGVQIFEGSPPEVVSSAAVQAAYLGEPDHAQQERM